MQKTSTLSLKNETSLFTLTLVIISVILVAALCAYIIYPVLASDWMKMPFSGSLLEPNMQFSSLATTQDSNDLGISPADQLKAVNGTAVKTPLELKGILGQFQSGETVELDIQSKDGSLRKVAAPLMEFPQQDRWAYFYVPYLTGLIFLFSGLWIFIERRKEASARSFALFCASLAILLGGMFDFLTTARLAFLWIFALPLGGAAAADLALNFPRPSTYLKKVPFLRPLIYFTAVLLAGLTIYHLYFLANFAGFAFWRAFCMGYSAVLLVISATWIALVRLKESSPVEHEQLRLILIGAAVSFSPVILWLLISAFTAFKIPLSPFLLLPLAIFPLVIAYTLQRYRIYRTDYFLSRTMLYSLLAVLVMVGYALLVAGLGTLLFGFVDPGSPIIAGLVIFILALAIEPVRKRLEKTADAVFFQGDRAYQERLQTFSGDLTHVMDAVDIIGVLRRYVQESLLPGQFHIFLYDPLSEEYTAAVDQNGRSTSDLHFSSGSPLVHVLANRSGAFTFSRSQSLPLDLEKEQVRLELLNSQIFVPLSGNQRLNGWLALGTRLSGQPYTARELDFLDSLSDQASLAIERAQVVDNLQDRMREMNVLTRISQGINITLSLDDILELIYAQTTNLIPAEDFQVLLHFPSTHSYEYLFYVEKDERLQEKENVRIANGIELEKRVISEAQSILTDQRSDENQRFGQAAGDPGVFAWMCVPLNSGAETIGALSLGRRDPSAPYNSEQLNLVQSIADQIAGAIVKARLLQETERRALQLQTLNEMTRQLSSTLDLEPLLNNILQSAVDILNSEAGSLLLLEEDSDELVFRVATGPVAEKLVNRRMASDRGVVGRVVETRNPAIVNNVEGYSGWTAETDKDTGFNTRSLLVVPLLVKEHILGVIEVVNRKDGMPFLQDDQNLLTAFAAQAAVAIENARLYTMTDQALASRVEELSIMQRIDQDLNASLDTGRAMRTTLEWALRQSGAEAGFLGIVHEEGLQVVETFGYPDDLQLYKDHPIGWDDLELDPTRQEVQLRSQNALKDQKLFFLNGAQEQIILPMKRESSVFGLLILESCTEGRAAADEMMKFLVRLCDRASIAISNAQLYAEVQRANVAKSEFVSFVSHELKNPMTSIKGYTELLAAGAVGPVTDMQKNFLGTIRSNVDRMTTLVSDLNDVSKMEAGRLRLDFDRVNMQDVVEEVMRSLRRQLEEKNQVVELHLAEDLPSGWGDKGRLVQIVTNLVSNSCKYTPADGKVIVAAESSPNHWDPNGARTVLHFWVKDNGIGISEEDQKKIFTKFFRSDDPKTREAPGTGLGLNITRNLVELQGGKIWFESVFRQGTTFHFTIPIAE